MAVPDVDAIGLPMQSLPHHNLHTSTSQHVNYDNNSENDDGISGAHVFNANHSLSHNAMGSCDEYSVVGKVGIQCHYGGHLFPIVEIIN